MTAMALVVAVTVPAVVEVVEAAGSRAFVADSDIIAAVRDDIVAVRQRDSACPRYSTSLLYFKGFHALQTYRVAHWL